MGMIYSIKWKWW